MNAGDYSVLATNLAGANLFRFAPEFLDNPPRVANAMLVGNNFFAQVMGIPNSNYVIQASRDSAHWTNLAAGSSVAGVINFTDSFNRSAPVRYYRAVLPSPIR